MVVRLMTTYNVLDTRRNNVGTYPRYPAFASYRAPCGITWIPLLVSENRVRFFALSTLEEVAVHVPNMTDMYYDVPLPPRMVALEDSAALLEWDIEQARIEWDWPHVFLTPDKAAQVNASAPVRVCIVKPAPVVISLWHDSMRKAA